MHMLTKHIPSLFISIFSTALTFSILPTDAQAEEHFRIGGSGTDLATMKIIAEKFAATQKNLVIDVLPSLGSSGGVKALRADKLDVALTSRPLKPKEKVSNIRAFNYARTALVFATSNKNSTENISSTQLKDIYSGKSPYWPNGSVARPILRPSSDSDTLLIKKHLPWLIKPLELAYQRRGVPIARTDQDSADKIEAVPGAIGTSTLSLIIAEKRPLNALQLNGITPSIETMTDKRYVLVKDLYLVTSKETSEIVKKFLRFVASKKGISILERTGHKVIHFSL